MASCDSPYTSFRHDERPQLGRQLVDRTRDPFERIGRLGLRRGLAPRAARPAGSNVSSIGSVALPAPLADVGRGGVGRDPVHPRRELGLAAELPDAPPGPQVSVLHHVARVLLVPRQAARQGEGVDEGAAHQLVERSSVTALGGADQLGLFHWLPFRGGSAPTCPPAERLRRARRAGPHAVDSRASRLGSITRVSLCTVWRRSQRQYFFISIRSRSFTLLFMVM